MSAWLFTSIVLFLCAGDPPTPAAEPMKLLPPETSTAAPTPAPSSSTDAPSPVTPAPAPMTMTKAAASSPLDIGGWLVNLARHQGHLIGRSDPRSAALHVMALLEAAKEISPDCGEAYFWLHDLYQRMGRSAEAKAALANYVRLTPADDTARIKLLSMEMEDRQTAESRAEFIRNELAAKSVSPIYESELHRWMAKHYHERGEKEPAGREIETSLRLNAMNVPARQLAYEMFGETEASLQRVEMALQLIAMNPSQVNLVWDLAEFLDRISMHKQAQEWYNRAIDLHRRAEAGPISAELLQKLAISYICSEDYAKAVQTADEALKVDPNYQPARLLRSNAQSKLGNNQAAEADKDAVLTAFQARAPEIISKKLSDEAAEVAWYFCFHHPDKALAKQLADVAMTKRSPGPLAKLADGYSLSMNGEVDAAIKALEPLAATDQMAALELAKIHLQRGDKALAVTILHKAAAIQPSGIAYNLIRDQLTQQKETAAAPPLNTKIVAALDKFQRDVFDYYRRTSDFLKVTLRFVAEPLPPAGPLEVVIRLENAGPFPITFGEGFMARPLLAVSAKLTGRETAEFKNYLQVLMNSRPVLKPGDAIEKKVAIDVGPLREKWIALATDATAIEVTAMFDPVYQGDSLAAGLGSMVIGPIKGARKAIETTPQAITALTDQATSGDEVGRANAAESIGALLVAAQANPSVTLPVDQLRGALARVLADRDWRVRAKAMYAAGWSPLDKSTTQAAAPAVQDHDSVVRLMAVQLFAAQQGDKFKDVLDHISKTDASQAVRTLARSYLPELTSAQATESKMTPDQSAP